MIARLSTVLAATLLVASVSTLAAQTPPPAQKPAAQPPPAQASKPTPPATSRTAAASARGVITLVVTDPVGKTLPDARVVLTGAMSREGKTSRDGALTFEGLRSGTYRLRLEAADFITLEREVTVRTGPAAEVDVALDPAPVKPVEPPPAPPQKCRGEVAVDSERHAVVHGTAGLG